ncbi:peptidoglycan recognition protein family protein [Streptomyces sp. URMC 123]|uniref:peptidoglycan recognition protein family protein n=1 Tax=Streptomyces sp. URMC 123 TaxID=3423403 RepID=UPI003F1AB635
MRAFIASSIGVVCSAALALPLTLPTGTNAVAAPGPAPSPPTVSGRTAYDRGESATPHAGTPQAGTPHAGAPPASPRRSEAEPAGSTQSLPLEPVNVHSPSDGPPDGAERRPPDGPSDRASALPRSGDGARGLTRHDVRPFSLLGVVWDDPEAELPARVEVRTRARGTGHWSGWEELAPYHEEAPDQDSPEAASGRTRGSTAPLWVGDSDGVEVRVLPDRSTRAAAPALPGGLRVDLVDPGEAPAADTAHEEEAGPDEAHEGARAGDTRAADPKPPVPPVGPGPAGPGPHPVTPPGPVDPAADTTGTRDAKDTTATTGAPTDLHAEAVASSAANAHFAPLGAKEIPELDKEASLGDVAAITEEPQQVKAGPFIGPRPRIVTRAGWGADERLRERGFLYTKRVKAAFIHHSATGNNYKCAQAPSVMRSIYRYHVKSSGWRDFGYNFAVDKCGTVYEGRAGGVAKAVKGAHTLGFNSDSMGIAVLGSYGKANPPAAAVKAVARLTAWKLGLYNANPRGTTHLVSAGSNKYKKGKKVKFKVISGHRDGVVTDCPGRRLYNKLGTARTTSAKLQGR